MRTSIDSGGRSAADRDWIYIGGKSGIYLCAIHSDRPDAVRLSCLQFFVCAIASAIIMLIKESSSVPAILSAWVPITYAGVLSSGVAYTLQIVAQKRTHPAVASLMFSLESVFAALAGWLILGQGMTPREIFGSALIFVAIVVSQLRSS